VSSTASTWSPRSSRPSSARRRGPRSLTSRDADPGAAPHTHDCLAWPGGMLGNVPVAATAGAVDLDMRDRWAVRAAKANAAAELRDDRWPTSGLPPMPATMPGGASSAAALSRRDARCGHRTRTHRSRLWHQAAGRVGSATPQRRGRRRRGGAQAARHAYGFVDIAALGLADVGVRQRWLGRVVYRQHALVCFQFVD